VPREEPTIAVALHEIEPATFERAALIRDWLDDHGVARVTLLVIPARDLHPLGERSPEMVQWLIERRRLGDSIGQHGFQHARLRRPGWPRRVSMRPRPARGGRSAEFVGLDDPETRRAVDAGWRLLKLAGIEPDGFVAPAYAYTPALRRVLGERFRWWASLLSLHGAIGLGEPAGLQTGAPTFPSRRAAASPSRRAAAFPSRRTSDGGDQRWRRLAPAWSLGSDRPLGRVLSPALIRAGAALAGGTVRIDVRPSDLDHPRHVLALEWALAHAGRSRTAVTYDELANARAGELSLPYTPSTPRLRAS
jgi:predicted deacetylase